MPSARVVRFLETALEKLLKLGGYSLLKQAWDPRHIQLAGCVHIILTF